jgi:hypothetical protein
VAAPPDRPSGGSPGPSWDDPASWSEFGAAHVLLGMPRPEQRVLECNYSEECPFPEYQHAGDLFQERLPWRPISFELVRELYEAGNDPRRDRAFPVFPPWSESNCHPLALRFMADELGGYFDARFLVDMAVHGIHWRLSAVDDLRGAKGRESNVGDDDAVDYIANVLLPKACAEKKMVRFTGAEAERMRRRCTRSPIFAVRKSNLVNGRSAYRIAQDLSAPLTSMRGTPLPSFNACTPADMLPSVPFGTAARLIDRLAFTRAVAIEKGFSQDDIFITAIDLTDAYYQWHIRKDQADFIAFDFLRDLYLLFGLPFGAQASPPIFGRFIHLTWCFQEQCLFVSGNWYMDDGTLVGFPWARAVRDHDLVVKLLKWMGVSTNVLKSMADPARKATVLGFVLDLESWTVSIKESTIVKLVGRVDELLQAGAGHRWKGRRLAKKLASLTGGLNFAEQVVRSVAPIKRSLQAVMRQAEKEPFFSLSPWDCQQLEMLRPWLTERNRAPIMSRKLERELFTEVRIHTDASGDPENGYGGWGLAKDGTLFHLRGLWADFTALPRDLGIADRELLTVLMAFQFLVPRVCAPAAPFLILNCDNTNANSWINRLECKSAEPHQRRRLGWLLLVAEWLFRENKVVEMDWLASEANNLADIDSRPSRYHEFDSALPAGALRVVLVQIPSGWTPGSLLSGSSS